MLDRSVPPETRIVVIGMPGAYQRWCYDNPGLRFKSINVTSPERMRGLVANRVIWLETPPHWTAAGVRDAVAQSKLIARAGENPRVEGEVPFDRADAISWLRAEVNTSIGETAVGKAEHDKAWSEFYRAMLALGVTRKEIDDVWK